jgi:predicted amidohydrolase YtcJ
MVSSWLIKLSYLSTISQLWSKKAPKVRNIIAYLKGLGMFDNLTLIKIWSENTVKTIFPSRKVGALLEGYEASFVALEGNPLQDFENIRKIKFRFKQGYQLN